MAIVTFEVSLFLTGLFSHTDGMRVCPAAEKNKRPCAAILNVIRHFFGKKETIESYYVRTALPVMVAMELIGPLTPENQE